jgi:ABC-2 type transport system ATP-binding protein
MIEGTINDFRFQAALEPDGKGSHWFSLREQSAVPDRLRVTEALERFGLAGRRRAVFSPLSGAERQRLFLMLSLLNRSRLVILDELTQGLDRAARRNIWAAVRQLHHEGVTGPQAIGMKA